MSKIQTNTIQHTASGAAIYTLPTTDGSAGQVLQTNGSGVLSWVTPGKLLQVQTTQTNAQSQVTLSSAYTLYDTPLSVDITSTGANSKFILSALLNGEGNAADHNFAVVIRRTIAGSGTCLLYTSDAADDP